jgi:hypothetical protein
MNATRTTYTVHGTLAGPLWWPVGEPASKTFEYRWERYATDRPSSLRDLADAIMAREDGDFSGAPLFLADTTLTITRWGATGHHGRSFDLSTFPSLSEYTSPEWPVWEGDES